LAKLPSDVPAVLRVGAGWHGHYPGPESEPGSGIIRAKPIPCPYPVGTRLWVQESYALSGIDTATVCAASRAKSGLPATCRYLADGEEREVLLTPDNVRKLAGRSTDLTRPLGGRFMYRSCSRTTLEVVSVRVERLQEISEADALAEGIRSFTKDGRLLKYWACDPAEDLPNDKHPLWCAWQCMPKDPRKAFRALWESIHEPGSWNANPWLWVVEFRKVEATP
jgi:hypothetical protein